MQEHLMQKAVMAIALAVFLSACGGGGGGSDSSNTSTAASSSSSFTQTATWAVALPAAGAAVCYDIDNKAPADCSGADWDLKLKSGGRTGTLWTNSGSSASASGNKGGTLGSPFNYLWADLQKWTRATRMPGETADIPAQAWLLDSVKNAFAGTNSIGSSAFEYGVGGDNHQMWPSYRTYVITTDNSKAYTDSNNADGVKVFTLQVTGYYGGSNGITSGYASFRFAERLDASTYGAVQTVSGLDARSAWVYYDLINNTVVDTPTAGNWHIAFNRYSVKLNNGDATVGSGPGTGGKMGGFVGMVPAGFYDGSGNPVVSAFTSATAANDTLPDLASGALSLPASASKWIKDAFSSPLNPDSKIVSGSPMTGNMVASYGWYTYYMGATEAAAAGLGAAHMIKANPENGSMLRSAASDSYARFHLKQISYADNSDSSSQQTWTFEFDIQPKP